MTRDDAADRDAGHVVVPGSRAVSASLTAPDGVTCVVACPPHPKHGGSRSDPRLRALAGTLGERGIACLRFDYGPWDEGRGERFDAESAVGWARDRFDRVGLFGYSFGGAVALAAARRSTPVSDCLCAVSTLAPPAASASIEARAAVADVDVPLQVLVGEADDAVNWRPMVDAARVAGATVVRLPDGHGFVGSRGRIARTVTSFFEAHCLADGEP